MSEENVQMTRDAIAAFNRNGVEGALGYLDPDIEWLGPPEWLEERLYLGHDGMRKLASFWTESFEEFRLDPERVIDLGGNQVLALINQRGRIKGSENWIEQPVGWHLELRDGQATRAEIYFTWTDALKAVGLEASHAMPEEPSTPDPVELVRKQVEALDRGDLDGVMSSVAEDVVLDGRADFFEGRAAIRGFLEDWFKAYEELDFELEEVSDLGNGVVFAVVIQDGRLVGSAGHIRQREGWVYICVGGLIARLTTSDVDQARAAAERLAEERR